MKTFNNFLEAKFQPYTIAVTPGIFNEWQFLEVDTLDPGSSQDKKDFVKAYEKAKKKGGKWIFPVEKESVHKYLTHRVGPIYNTIDIASDNNRHALVRSLEKLADQIKNNANI